VQQSYVPHPHQSPASSTTSFQSSQYTNNGSQPAPWDTPNKGGGGPVAGTMGRGMDEERLMLGGLFRRFKASYRVCRYWWHDI
jgi:hypothetical protein